MSREKKSELNEVQIRLLGRCSPEFRERHIDVHHSGEPVAVDTLFVGTIYTISLIVGIEWISYLKIGRAERLAVAGVVKARSTCCNYPIPDLNKQRTNSSQRKRGSQEHSTHDMAIRRNDMPTDAFISFTSLGEGSEAGSFLGREIAARFSGEPPDAVVVFASSKYDYEDLLGALQRECEPKVMAGCSSAGEFMSGELGEGSACAIALRSSDMCFNAALGRSLRKDTAEAATELVAGLSGISDYEYPFRTALVLTDALAGHSQELVEHLTALTGGTYQFIGGGAGDDAKFEETCVFYGTEAVKDAVVALEMLSRKPLGIGVAHGWTPSSDSMRVTESNHLQLVSMNATPSIEVFQEHAERKGQKFNVQDPLPFFLQNVLGIEEQGSYRLRVPLSVNANGSITCASDVPEGTTVCLMKGTDGAALEAARAAVQTALKQLHGHKPLMALFFDCVATRLRLGQEGFGLELRAVQDMLGNAPYAGINTYGQIARAEGQFSGFHNCTAIVCVIPE